MKIFNRIRDLLVKPEQTWQIIKDETDQNSLIRYALLLPLIPALSIFIGYSIVGLRVGDVGYFRMPLVNAFFSAIVGYFLTSLGIGIMGFLILIVSNYFSIEGDIWSAIKLAVYSGTAPILAGIFYLVPGIKILSVLGLYGTYILFLGVPKLFKAPREKEPTFVFFLVITAVIVLISIDFLISQYIFGSLYSEIFTY